MLLFYMDLVFMRIFFLNFLISGITFFVTPSSIAFGSIHPPMVQENPQVKQSDTKEELYKLKDNYKEQVRKIKEDGKERHRKEKDESKARHKVISDEKRTQMKAASEEYRKSKKEIYKKSKELKSSLPSTSTTVAQTSPVVKAAG